MEEPYRRGPPGDSPPDPRARARGRLVRFAILVAVAIGAFCILTGKV